ncbi:MAG: hypothetical protein H3Z53_08810 [archaeon]|nr:hypothetical protein [archaeon]MCP8314452.1 hypothetical protein [archaeon]MCP8319989.1 hypothetical protein [archaeon]
MSLNPIKLPSQKKVVIVGTFIFAILVSILYFVLQPTNSYLVLSNIVVVAISGCATLAAYLIIRKYRWNIHNSFSKCWLFFFLGALFWSLGELSWAIYVLGFGIEVPYPSIGDVFWLIGYAPFFMAFLGYFRMFGLPFASKKKLVVIGGIMFLSSIMMKQFLLYPILALEDEPLVMLFNLAYPIGDFLLIAVAIGSLVVFFGQKIGKPFIYLASSVFIINAIADTLFSFLTTTGEYIYGSYLTTLNDLLFVWGYFALFLGFYIHLKEF